MSYLRPFPFFFLPSVPLSKATPFLPIHPFQSIKSYRLPHSHGHIHVGREIVDLYVTVYRLISKRVIVVVLRLSQTNPKLKRRAQRSLVWLRNRFWQQCRMSFSWIASFRQSRNKLNMLCLFRLCRKNRSTCRFDNVVSTLLLVWTGL